MILFIITLIVLAIVVGQMCSGNIRKFFVQSYDDDEIYLCDGTSIARSLITEVQYDEKELGPYLIYKNKHLILVLPKEES